MSVLPCSILLSWDDVMNGTFALAVNSQVLVHHEQARSDAARALPPI